MSHSNQWIMQLIQQKCLVIVSWQSANSLPTSSHSASSLMLSRYFNSNYFEWASVVKDHLVWWWWKTISYGDASHGISQTRFFTKRNMLQKVILGSSDLPPKLCGVMVGNINLVRFLGQKIHFASLFILLIEKTGLQVVLVLACYYLSHLF